MFSTSDNTITLIYHSGDSIAKSILAYAKAEGLPIREIDIAHTKISETNWAEFAEKMNIEIKDFVNQDHPNFNQHYDEHVELDDHDWLKFLEKNPATLRGPIVMKGSKIQMMSNPQDMVHFH